MLVCLLALLSNKNSSLNNWRKKQRVKDYKMKALTYISSVQAALVGHFNLSPLSSVSITSCGPSPG